MRKLLFAVPVFILMACGGNNPSNDTSDHVDILVDVPAITVYGDSTITADGAIEPQEFFRQIVGKDSLQTKLRATIVETCKKKGCWMTLDMENGEPLRVRFKDYGFFVPTEGVDGKTVIIEGYAYTDTISVAELKHLAEDGNKSAEEIAAITEPEIGINFEATGVIIEN